MVLPCIEVNDLRKACFPARGYCNRRLQCYRPTHFSGAESGSENCKVWYLCIVMRIASLRHLIIPPQICTAWCTKLRKHFNAIVSPLRSACLVMHHASDYNSVATLLLRKSIRFHDKKTLESQKKH